MIKKREHSKSRILLYFKIENICSLLEEILKDYLIIGGIEDFTSIFFLCLPILISHPGAHSSKLSVLITS